MCPPNTPQDLQGRDTDTFRPDYLVIGLLQCVLWKRSRRGWVSLGEGEGIQQGEPVRDCCESEKARASLRSVLLLQTGEPLKGGLQLEGRLGAQKLSLSHSALPARLLRGRIVGGEDICRETEAQCGSLA